nr:ankyrin repeat domain-containing protein [Brachyspira hyodysenteriae]
MREIEIELHEASAKNNVLAVEILLKNKDIDVNLSNILGLTPLTHACKAGYK